MITKPMLAVNCSDPAALRYPQLATPKLDGIRCLILPTEGSIRRAVTRTFKPVKNHFIREWLEANLPCGLDGELMVRGRTFSEGSGDINRADGRPDFCYHVFDYSPPAGDLRRPYEDRMADLLRFPLDASRVQKVLPVRIASLAELSAYEEKCLAEGYEGVMLRTPDSPYKCGRSTENEGYLLKIKRFEDAEAEIIGFEELTHNGNEATKDAFGRTKRSSHQENLSGTGTLGALICRYQGLEFGIGTGFDAHQRATYWQERHRLPGRLAKFKHQPSGAKVAPRFPVFLGFRDPDDIGEPPAPTTRAEDLAARIIASL